VRVDDSIHSIDLASRGAVRACHAAPRFYNAAHFSFNASRSF